MQFAYQWHQLEFPSTLFAGINLNNYAREIFETELEGNREERQGI